MTRSKHHVNMEYLGSKGWLGLDGKPDLVEINKEIKRLKKLRTKNNSRITQLNKKGFTENNKGITEMQQVAKQMSKDFGRGGEYIPNISKNTFMKDGVFDAQKFAEFDRALNKLESVGTTAGVAQKSYKMMSEQLESGGLSKQEVAQTLQTRLPKITGDFASTMWKLQKENDYDSNEVKRTIDNVKESGASGKDLEKLEYRAIASVMGVFVEDTTSEDDTQEKHMLLNSLNSELVAQKQEKGRRKRRVSLKTR